MVELLPIALSTFRQLIGVLGLPVGEIAEHQFAGIRNEPFHVVTGEALVVLRAKGAGLIHRHIRFYGRAAAGAMGPARD